MISKYIELFGTKLTPTEKYLPPVFLPSSSGWITEAQDDLATAYSEGSKEQMLLNILNEKYFQQMFGRRKLPGTYALVNSNYAAYGLTEEQAKAMLQDEVDLFIRSRIPDWVKMMDAYYAEYDPIANYSRHEEGSDTTTYTGSETDTKAGSEEMAKTGSEELAYTGSESTTKTGTESTTKTGTESTSKTGTETTAKSGSEINEPAGSTTTTVQNNANGYNSSTSVPTSDSTTTESFSIDRSDTLRFDEREDTLSFDERADTLSFDERADTLSFDERADTLSFDQRKDTTSFNNRKDTLTFNQRTDTHSFTDRADTREWESDVFGNIGTLTTQAMITSEVDMRKRDLFILFHREIADRFLLSVY